MGASLLALAKSIYYIPSKKVCSYNLMSAFVNRLIFKLNLSTG